MTGVALPGRWFHSGGTAPQPGPADRAAAAKEQAEALERLSEQRRAQSESLRLSIGELQRELVDLGRARARLAAEAAVAAGAGSGRGLPAEAFWSPTPVLGFRVWRLAAAGVRGVVRVWEKPRLDAWCATGPGAPHESPPCHCGVYAFKQARALAPCLLRIAPWSVLGLVALTGRVVEHERGYRAQRAEVLAVAVVGGGHAVCRSDPGFVARLFIPGMGLGLAQKAANGVDADPVEYLEDQARRFGEPWTSASRSE